MYGLCAIMFLTVKATEAPVSERMGKDLEKLVMQLETALANDNAMITSNEEIPDVVTGEPREVDVAVRTGAGSSHLLVIIECRDRKGKQDVRWIEELSGKRRSVGADKAVAVSRNGLSAQALLKAKDLGIAVARIQDVSIEDIRSWCQFDGITLHQFVVKFEEFSIGLDPSAAKQSGPVKDPMFIRKISGERCTVLDVWNSIIGILKQKGNDLYDGIASDSSRRERQVRVSYANPDDCYQIEIDGQRVDIKEIKVRAEFWLEDRVVPPTRIFTYGQEGGPAVDVLEFDGLPRIGTEWTGLRLQHNDTTGQVSIVALRSRPDGA